ncbi:NAD(P)-binding domain-containing protein [Streptomyces sp. NPDC046859]|uniref:NADPH-dependent F420 reductase n=1 Tax=Streptomyces sp. NPDC046859 TaxID=3155734 RepID=UPI003406839E
MRIGILGTGMLATALATGWARAGHEVAVAGRSRAKAERVARQTGDAVEAVAPREAVGGRDAVLLAVTWGGIEDMLRLAGAPEGALDGTPLIDPTNAVAHGVGALLVGPGESAAGRIARLAPGARVVKAFHLFPPDRWAASPASAKAPVTVAMCGDDPAALKTVGDLVRDVGGIPATLGTLDRVRQLEEVAGFVIGLAFAGVDPNSAVPVVPSAAVRTGTGA